MPEKLSAPCAVPPKGWTCSRDAGHEGPCAATQIQPESGWLLDDGILCIGVRCGKFATVTYTDENALRFARKQDAETFRAALRTMNPFFAASLTPREHQWG